MRLKLAVRENGEFFFAHGYSFYVIGFCPIRAMVSTPVYPGRCPGLSAAARSGRTCES